MESPNTWGCSAFEDRGKCNWGEKSQVEQVVQTRKEGLVDFDKDLDVLHAKVDNTNYFLKKNNIKTSGLKEGVERREGSGFIFGRSFFLDW